MKPKWIWEPSPEQIKTANVTAFMKKHDIASYNQLILNATTGIEWFWEASIKETKVEFYEPFTHLIDASKGFANTQWFVSGRINMAYNCVDRHAMDKNTAHKVAHIWQGECGAVSQTTYQELFEQSNQVADALTQMNIGRNDAVALYMPMLKELLPIYFGILKVGAVVVPIFSGYAAVAVEERLQHAKVQVVFTADESLRRGEALPLKANLDAALKNLPHLKKCLVVRRTFTKSVPMQSPRDEFFDEWIKDKSQTFKTLELPSEHPCMVLYTSGTTGKPKGTLHTHAGVLAQVAKEHYFHFDLKPEDVFVWVTDIGWMMGPWVIIGATHFGATVVTIEGSPLYPKPNRVFSLVQSARVTHLGVSPTLVRVWMNQDFKKSDLKLDSLRLLGSTGEPWDADSYLWFFNQIGKTKIPIINISGGTELMGCLLAPLPTLPLKPASLQGPALGMAVDIFDENGRSAKENEVGYLVCKKPAPSMSKGFLGDNQRFYETYFSKFKDVWNHGDWAVRDEDGQWFLKGRSDDTLKIAGKRVGPSEIESCLCDHPLVNEACAFGVPEPLKGEAVVTLVVLKKGFGETAFLLNELKEWVALQLGKTLKPSFVHVVFQLPKTRSGKIVRSTLKRYYLNQDNLDLSSLENPDLLKSMPRSLT